MRALLAVAGWTLADPIWSSPACAQQVVRVLVTDSTRRPVPLADLAVFRGDTLLFRAGATDSNGYGTIVLPTNGHDLRIRVRRIGFQPFESAISPDQAGNTLIGIQLSELAQSVDGMKISARPDLKRRRLFVDSLAIAHSNRPLQDASDILKKLRPDMIAGLSGFCPPVQEIWVNGKRIHPFDVPPDEIAAARRVATTLKRVPAHVMTVLSRIHPEHIAEMTYHDCTDMSVGQIGSENALFVVLKPGVAFSFDEGSHERALAHASGRERPPIVPPYEKRLLGVFDEAGSPLEGCNVIDLATGTTARTTRTGTVSLGFVADGRATLRITKPGYAPLTVAVVISPADTVPLSFILKRR